MRRIIEKRGSILTEGQIETAGKAYVQATVWTMAADLVLDGVRVVGRTMWRLAILAGLGYGALWIFIHWPQIARWLL